MITVRHGRVTTREYSRILCSCMHLCEQSRSKKNVSVEIDVNAQSICRTTEETKAIYGDEDKKVSEIETEDGKFRSRDM